MKCQNIHSVDQEKLKSHLPIVLNSGLFLLDDDHRPIGLFKLRNSRNKELCKRKNSIIRDLPELNCRVVARKLNRIIYYYKNNIPRSIYLTFDWDSDDLARDFEIGIKKYLESQMFQPNELQPHLDNLIKKAKRVLKKKYEQDWFPTRKKSKDKERYFLDLIAPLYAIFDKYLNDRKKSVNQTNIFHYISNLLIACSIEKTDPQRGHMPVFEKIKQYNSRHSKYLSKYLK